MFKIKKNDMVKVIAGKDKGKTGKVLRLLPSKDMAIVQSVNFVKKHARKRRQDDQAGIIEQEAAIHISNLAVYCKKCDESTNVGIDVLNDGSKVRFCKKCKETV